MDVVGLRPREPTKLIGLLSGGNQQKVVIGKWLAAQSKFLILDEPTRGIDVAARQEIYDVIRREARDTGLGVLLLSSDMRGDSRRVGSYPGHGPGPDHARGRAP